MNALLLCGGGSRGAIEVGLYKALAELEIPIDLIFGTSVGALNGAVIAAGATPAELAALWRRLEGRPLFPFGRSCGAAGVHPAYAVSTGSPPC